MYPYHSYIQSLDYQLYCYTPEELAVNIQGSINYIYKQLAVMLMFKLVIPRCRSPGILV